MAFKNKRKNSPTHGRSAVDDPPRRGVKMPNLFVLVKGAGTYGGGKYMAARLRGKGGYLYLQFRERGKVRSVYVGRAKKSSPTKELTSPAPADPGRRAKKRGGGA